jgi:hypothetical protein
MKGLLPTVGHDKGSVVMVRQQNSPRKRANWLKFAYLKKEVVCTFRKQLRAAQFLQGVSMACFQIPLVDEFFPYKQVILF